VAKNKRATRGPKGPTPPPGKPAREVRSSGEKLSARQREVLALFQTAKAISPGRSRLTLTVEALERRGLVRRVAAGGRAGEVVYELAVEVAVEPAKPPAAEPERARRRGGPAALRPTAAAATPPAIQKGDVVQVKGSGLTGCVLDTPPDGTVWLCVLLLGRLTPFQFPRGALDRVGPGSGPCWCQAPS
jgi:hypothetical protein